MRNLFEEIRKESLNPHEKAEILRSLRGFMAEHPVKRIKSPFWNNSSFFRSKVLLVMASTIFVFTTTLGTAFAANRSLPGDLLYPVKLLRENIQSFVTVGAKANAEVDARHAVTRLQEAEQLAIDGRLNEETKKQIAVTFEVQTTRALKHIDELRSEGNANGATAMSLDFQSSLAGHQKTISEIRDGGSENNSENNMQIGNVAIKTEIRSGNTSQMRGKKRAKEDSRSKGTPVIIKIGDDTEIRTATGTSTTATTNIASSTQKGETDGRSGEDSERER